MLLLNVDCKTPIEAIKIAGNLLVDNGYCNNNYVDKMIEKYKELGEYIVVDSQIAMPHARPEDGAIKSGFSIITLKKPITFGHEENDPVSIVFGLVASSSFEHIRTIQTLAILCESKEFLNSLLSGNKNEIYKYINKD
ncbi:PTS sugar transporter subunit IIA [Vibrio sp. NTOU-M3]|uniref:PTS sugar transporter subunit IIA n=1 Tax=Vibrio sp. NTOU-M3 TaxID=3234954 RepID=UPI00349FC2F0